MHLPHLRELDDLFEIVALADPDRETLDLVGEHYRVDRRVASFAELLAQPLDAVLILTPGSHAPECLAAVGAGKHVFVEKPLCYTLRECDEIAAAVDRAGTTLQVGYMKRYDPAYRRAAALLGRVEDLRYVSITTVHPSSNLFFAHHAIRRRRGEPPAHPYAPMPYPVPAGDPARADTDERRLLREGLAAADGDEEAAAAFKVMLTSLCHDVNALRGLLGEPAAVLACEARHGGGTISVQLEYPRDLLVHYAFAYVPDLRDYREELAFYGAAERLRLVFPSPFLRNMPTELFHARADDGAAGESRLVVGYEEAFAEELRAFHHNATTRSRPETDVADSRADLVVLTAMGRLAATRAR
jgi:predicted dehydrogenase